ncbi:MAG: LytR C-terminal domain-containing protein [Actinobacteria bacterium]|nr:LytR C-terminal domain-containing protein [Actinomycetota bacterium]
MTDTESIPAVPAGEPAPSAPTVSGDNSVLGPDAGDEGIVRQPRRRIPRVIPDAAGSARPAAAPVPEAPAAPREPAAAPVAEPVEPTPVPARRPRIPNRRAVAVFSVATLLFGGGLVALARFGYDTARDVRGVAAVDPSLGPTEPGYVAELAPSPVELLAWLDDEGALSAYVVAAPAAQGGTIVWIPGELYAEVDAAQRSLADIFAADRAAARAAVERVLGFGATDTLTMGDAELTAWLGGTGTLMISNPDAVTVGSGEGRTTRFASGRIEVAPSKIGAYLTTRSVDEVPLNRSIRVQTLVEAALAATASASASGAAPVLAEGGADLSAVLSALAAGQVGFVTLPTDEATIDGAPRLVPAKVAIAEQLAGAVEFPSSAFPGQRPRVHVLNGTSDTDAAARVAPLVTRAGGEVLLIGNADRFDATITTVRFFDPSSEAVANEIATVLGVTATRAESASESEDIIVILGPGQTGTS